MLQAIAGELAAAQHHVDELSAAQRSFLVNGRASLSLSYGVGFACAFYNCLFGVGFADAWIHHGPSSESVIAVVLLVAISIVLVGFTIWRFHRRIREAEVRFSASPPPVDGAPPACRLCGGDLAASSPSARVLVACRYCRAQNLLVPGALRADGARVAADAHAIRRKILAHGGTRRWHERFLIARLVLTLAANFVAGTLIWIETGPTLPRKLAFLEQTYPRACVSRWTVRSLGAEVTMLRPSGLKRHPVFEGPMASSGTSYDYFTARALVGRTVEVMHERPWSGHVVGSSGNTLSIDAGGQRVNVPAHAVCVARLLDEESALR